MNALHCVRHFTTEKKYISPASFPVYTLCMGNGKYSHETLLRDDRLY